MQPSESRAALETLLRRSGVRLDALRAPDALRFMAAFYGEERAEGCRLEEQGDMLLYQWGTYAFEPPETFQLDLTRQFMRDTGDDDMEMSQVSLTLHFEPAESLRALEAGDQWCHHPDGLAEWERLVRESAAFRAAAEMRPARVTLHWGLV